MAEEGARGVSLPLVIAVAATRALAGVGLGLLLSEGMDRETRRAIGASLLAAGVASTVPLLRHVASCVCPAQASRPA